jgi:hypothetical protein
LSGSDVARGLGLAVWSTCALLQHIPERIGRRVQMSVGMIIKKRSAFLPIAMSLGALVLLLWHVLAFGVVRQADEGAAARVYQLLMAAQVPIVAYFAITWLPRAPKQALLVLALPVGAALLTLAPLLLLGL